jgi:hypothetical protein
MTYQNVLVAFVVEGDTMQEAQQALMPLLPDPTTSDVPHSPLDSWWIAMNERHDGNDPATPEDTVVFVSEVLAVHDGTREHLRLLAE